MLPRGSISIVDVWPCGMSTELPITSILPPIMLTARTAEPSGLTPAVFMRSVVSIFMSPRPGGSGRGLLPDVLMPMFIFITKWYFRNSLGVNTSFGEYARSEGGGGGWSCAWSVDGRISKARIVRGVFMVSGLVDEVR